MNPLLSLQKRSHLLYIPVLRHKSNLHETWLHVHGVIQFLKNGESDISYPQLTDFRRDISGEMTVYASKLVEKSGYAECSKRRRGTDQMGQRSGASCAGRRRAKCGFVFLVKHQGSRDNRVGLVLLGE